MCRADYRSLGLASRPRKDTVRHPCQMRYRRQSLLKERVRKVVEVIALPLHPVLSEAQNETDLFREEARPSAEPLIHRRLTNDYSYS